MKAVFFCLSKVGCWYTLLCFLIMKRVMNLMDLRMMG